MGAVEHLKTLCCLGLPPESAMVRLRPCCTRSCRTGWCRIALLEPDAAIGHGYSENPAAAAIFRERMWRFIADPSSPLSLWMPAFYANAIGWTLSMQGRAWLESDWYREIEAPFDSCWILDAMIGDASPTFALAHLTLTRPRGGPSFTVDDVQRLDRLRPWLAHAFHGATLGDVHPEDQDLLGTTGAPVLSGQMILTADATLVFQTPRLETLLLILAREPGNYTRHLPTRDRLPAPILKLLRRIGDASDGSLGEPPRMRFSTAHGVLMLEAKWLAPAGAQEMSLGPERLPHRGDNRTAQHAVAHAARVLRESGATPAQVKVGVQLALGKAKPAIADELGIQLSSVACLTKKLYQTLDVHNSAGLGRKIWRGETQSETPGFGPHAAPLSIANGVRKAQSASIFRS